MYIAHKKVQKFIWANFKVHEKIRLQCFVYDTVQKMFLRHFNKKYKKSYPIIWPSCFRQTNKTQTRQYICNEDLFRKIKGEYLARQQLLSYPVTVQLTGLFMFALSVTSIVKHHTETAAAGRKRVWDLLAGSSQHWSRKQIYDQKCDTTVTHRKERIGDSVKVEIVLENGTKRWGKFVNLL